MSSDHSASCFCGSCMIDRFEEAELGTYFEFQDDTASEICAEITDRQIKAARVGLVTGAFIGLLVGISITVVVFAIYALGGAG